MFPLECLFQSLTWKRNKPSLFSNRIIKCIGYRWSEPLLGNKWRRCPQDSTNSSPNHWSMSRKTSVRICCQTEIQICSTGRIVLKPSRETLLDFLVPFHLKKMKRNIFTILNFRVNFMNWRSKPIIWKIEQYLWLLFDWLGCL